MSLDRDKLAEDVQSLARQNVYLGTSSWKYAGWCGSIYDSARYLWRGRFAQKRFEEACLAEYARTFKTVCVDGAYYRFPSQKFLDSMVSQVSEDFLFALKVTDEITIKKFTNLPRFGDRAGQFNPNFMNADLFASDFLTPCEPYRGKIGLLIFEFSRFYPSDFAKGRDFVKALDNFLDLLPEGWLYGVEIRNRYFLHSDYFATLRRHGVTHVYNSWADMPAVSEQMSNPLSVTRDDACAARFLLKPGRKYQQAVDLFSPYNLIREPSAEARTAGAALIKQGLNNPSRKTFIYVNNRLEGNAPQTIAAMIEQTAPALV